MSSESPRDPERSIAHDEGLAQIPKAANGHLEAEVRTTSYNDTSSTVARICSLYYSAAVRSLPVWMLILENNNNAGNRCRLLRFSGPY